MRIMLGILALVAAAAPLAADTVLQGGRTRLAAVSVTPSASDTSLSLRWTPGRLEATRVTFRVLLLTAYPEVKADRFIAMPAWHDTARFDIVASADPALTDTYDGRLVILRSLLEDRFGLRLRPETQSVETYALVRARTDGRLGARLQRSTLACDAPGRVSPTPLATLQVLSGSGERPACGSTQSAGLVAIGGMPMPMLAFSLRFQTRLDVVDRTGLTGSYDAVLSFSPDATVPAIAAALEQQLGLTLRLQRDAIDVQVIERVERPAAD